MEKATVNSTVTGHPFFDFTVIRSTDTIFPARLFVASPSFPLDPIPRAAR
jgi:hypothetical protein